MTQTFDPVQRPQHYNDGEIECIDAIRVALGDDKFLGYCQGNAMKYTWRGGKKDNEQQDAEKAHFYTQMAAHVLSPERVNDPRTYRAPHGASPEKAK